MLRVRVIFSLWLGRGNHRTGTSLVQEREGDKSFLCGLDHCFIPLVLLSSKGTVAALIGCFSLLPFTLAPSHTPSPRYLCSLEDTGPSTQWIRPALPRAFKSATLLAPWSRHSYSYFLSLGLCCHFKSGMS